MKILTKSLVTLASVIFATHCFANTELHLELNNQTNRTLKLKAVQDGEKNPELTQVDVLGDFPTQIAAHANKIMALKFWDGILDNISLDHAKATYEIICPNNTGVDYLTIEANAYIIPNPRSISYGITVKKTLEGNHCVKLQDGNGSIDIVDGQASLTIIHS